MDTRNGNAGIGLAECTGGTMPDPPIDQYPLLVWTGGVVMTEDGRASIEDIAEAAAMTPDPRAIASQLGTTPDHVAEALSYVRDAGL